jgi:hypothetical protein
MLGNKSQSRGVHRYYCHPFDCEHSDAFTSLGNL